MISDAVEVLLVLLVKQLTTYQKHNMLYIQGPDAQTDKIVLKVSHLICFCKTGHTFLNQLHKNAYWSNLKPWKLRLVIQTGS